MRPLKRILVVLMLAAAVVTVAVAPALAQPVAQESPCVPGQLCSDTGILPTLGNIGTEVNDPGGNYVRTFIFMALIAVVVGGYLAVALGGKKLPFRRAAAR